MNTTINNFNASNLSIEKLRQSFDIINSTDKEYTRGVWDSLGSKYGSFIIGAASLKTLIKLEYELQLCVVYRPKWLHINNFIDDGMLYFIHCQCLCHDNYRAIRFQFEKDCNCQCFKG